MTALFTDLAARYRRGDVALRFIYLNGAVFAVAALVTVVCTLMGRPDWSPVHFFECPADPLRLLVQPWSAVTYMFMHIDPLHVLFNMLWLYWFGRLFLQLFSAKHFRGLYILGGLCGALAYVLAFNLFPYFRDHVAHSYLLGASASVLAIAVATAVRQPDYRVSLLLVGSVRLKYLALVLVATDLLFITSSNGGGHIAHLGGALAGWWWARALQGGYDPTGWINYLIDRVGALLTRRPRRRPRMKVHYGTRAADYDYNARRRNQEEKIDRILEKLKKSGYGSLSEDEKKSLFDASKK